MWILPCSLLISSQEDFNILVDVLHPVESFEEILENVWINVLGSIRVHICQNKIQSFGKYVFFWEKICSVISS